MTASGDLYEAIGAQGKDWCACGACHEKRKRLIDAHRTEVLEEGAQLLEAEAARGQKMGVTRIAMRADAHRLRALATGEEPLIDLVADEPDRCPECLCGDCGGRLDEHTETGCSCEDCGFSLSLQCSLGEFAPDEGIGYIAEQLGPLLSSHLNEEAKRRCLAVAHAAHHGLREYDAAKAGTRP